MPSDYLGVSVLDIYPGTVVWNIYKKSFNGSIPEFSYSKIKSFNNRLKFPSPNPRFERSELKLLEARAYSKVYNDERISRILMSVRSEFDRKKVIQMFNSKKKFIKDNYKLLCKAGLILTIIKKTITGLKMSDDRNFSLSVFLFVFNKDYSKILLIRRNEEKRLKWVLTGE